MATKKPGQLKVTFSGLVNSTHDAFILVEACMRGNVQLAQRRPRTAERARVIRSGNIIVYEEHSCNMSRWTDGFVWSPSRMCGNFLVYRQLAQPYIRGETKRHVDRYLTALASNNMTRPGMAPGIESVTLADLCADPCLLSAEGLIKKTIMVTFEAMKYHVVSYLTVDDLENQRFSPISRNPLLMPLKPRMGMSSPFRRISTTAVEPLTQQWLSLNPHTHPRPRPMLPTPAPSPAPTEARGTTTASSYRAPTPITTPIEVGGRTRGPYYPARPPPPPPMTHPPLRAAAEGPDRPDGASVDLGLDRPYPSSPQQPVIAPQPGPYFPRGTDLGYLDDSLPRLLPDFMPEFKDVDFSDLDFV